MAGFCCAALGWRVVELAQQVRGRSGGLWSNPRIVEVSGKTCLVELGGMVPVI